MLEICNIFDGSGNPRPAISKYAIFYTSSCLRNGWSTITRSWIPVASWRCCAVFVSDVVRWWGGVGASECSFGRAPIQDGVVHEYWYGTGNPIFRFVVVYEHNIVIVSKASTMFHLLYRNHCVLAYLVCLDCRWNWNLCGTAIVKQLAR